MLKRDYLVTLAFALSWLIGFGWANYGHDNAWAALISLVILGFCAWYLTTRTLVRHLETTWDKQDKK
ncbi:hypothetical protein [Schaalia sp. lx-100]|uniref:hypothetical protein n=1 Tax=Schaalia sp. lx-100 TaxID=2899081 RepID=UPI001E63F299|nr:hypothetical protein [Schaalia sp. lx-100]MCD4557195.1 hypothetical protein [Schaalia sp. lx-100]